jgi:hypothetical protein
LKNGLVLGQRLGIRQLPQCPLHPSGVSWSNSPCFTGFHEVIRD